MGIKSNHLRNREHKSITPSPVALQFVCYYITRRAESGPSFLCMTTSQLQRKCKKNQNETVFFTTFWYIYMWMNTRPAIGDKAIKT